MQIARVWGRGKIGSVGDEKIFLYYIFLAGLLIKST